MKMTEVFIITIDDNTEINSGSLGATEFLSIRKDISNSTAMIRISSVEDVVRIKEELNRIQEILAKKIYSDKVRESFSSANLESKVGPYVDMKFETTPLHGTPKSKALVDEEFKRIKDLDEEKFKKFNDSIERKRREKLDI